MDVHSPRWKTSIRQIACSRPLSAMIKTITGGSIPNHGARIDTTHPAVELRTNAELLWGFYEKRELAFIRKVLDPNRDVIELGGSIGVTGSHILRRIRPSRRLISVEANPALIPGLRANLERHGAGRYEIVQAAIDYSGAPVVDMQLSSAAVGSHVGRFAETERVAVPTTTLAEVTNRLGARRYSLLCDIEGAEHDMVQQDRYGLRRCEQLIVELHGWAERYEPTLHALRYELGFRQVAQRRFVFVFARGC